MAVLHGSAIQRGNDACTGAVGGGKAAVGNRQIADGACDQRKGRTARLSGKVDAADGVSLAVEGSGKGVQGAAYGTYGGEVVLCAVEHEVVVQADDLAGVGMAVEDIICHGIQLCNGRDVDVFGPRLTGQAHEGGEEDEMIRYVSHI